MFLTILSMSDCLGMCLQIIDNGVSIGTSASGVCVYVVPPGLRRTQWRHRTFDASGEEVGRL